MKLRSALTWIAVCALAVAFLPTKASGAAQQWTAEKPGSDNITVVSHLPLGPRLSIADLELEQEMSRPYAYVARMVYGTEGDKGMDIIDLHDPANPKVIYRWRIENQDLHLGTGGMDVKHFKWNGRYYVVQSVQFGQGGPDSDMGAVVLDVTGLPDPSTVKEVGRLAEPELPGGFHNIFYLQAQQRPGVAVHHCLRPLRPCLRPGLRGGGARRRGASGYRARAG